jgi:hypothetical protein
MSSEVYEMSSEVWGILRSEGSINFDDLTVFG